jgi:diaminohydroxyphosphoribosylaminopyrimidine deaminase/5-amino-6-(5-phosphoribosylamino)uracil reductase
MAKEDAPARDERFMRRALRLARKGEGRVSPNPLVGAVIVKGGRIIGEGYHRCCGENHAEINAWRGHGAGGRGHHYITWSPAAISAAPRPAPRPDPPATRTGGIGTRDPNPLVAGRGIALLKQAGIPVATGILEEECRRLNEVFFKYIQTGRPFVTLKLAQTLDGRIATATGDSRWVSSPASLAFAHRLRRQHDAILVGSGTVLADDPALTLPARPGQEPLADRGRLPTADETGGPPCSFRTRSGPPSWPTLRGLPRKRIHPFAERGVEVWEMGADAHRTGWTLQELLTRLGERGITLRSWPKEAPRSAHFAAAGAARGPAGGGPGPQDRRPGTQRRCDLGILGWPRPWPSAFSRSAAGVTISSSEARPLPATVPDAPPPGGRPGRS